MQSPSKLFVNLNILVHNTDTSKLLYNLCIFLDAQEMTVTHGDSFNSNLIFCLTFKNKLTENFGFHLGIYRTGGRRECVLVMIPNLG